MLLLCGCSLIQQLAGGGFETPTLVFREARLQRVDFAGAQLELVFTVTNPNPAGLELSTAKYALQVEGHQVVAGAPARGLRIPPRASTEMAFPAEVRWSEIAPALAALFAQDAVHYVASGEIGIDTPIGLVTLPLQHEGTFASPRMPKLSLGSPQLVSLSFLGARLLLPLTVSNGNDFPLPIAGITGEVTVATAPVGHIALPEQPPIAAHSQAVLEVPLELLFLTTGPGVAEAIRSGVAEIALEVTVNAAGASLPLRITQTVQLRR
jgi:LEA14-like dessication related protein